MINDNELKMLIAGMVTVVLIIGIIFACIGFEAYLKAEQTKYYIDLDNVRYELIEVE